MESDLSVTLRPHGGNQRGLMAGARHTGDSGRESRQAIHAKDRSRRRSIISSRKDSFRVVDMRVLGPTNTDLKMVGGPAGRGST